MKMYHDMIGKQAEEQAVNPSSSIAGGMLARPATVRQRVEQMKAELIEGVRRCDEVLALLDGQSGTEQLLDALNRLGVR